MSNPYLGELRPFAGNFAPRNWALCNGALLSIAQNNALFALLGTTYGGDGVTTFGLPDLRGRVAISQGQGPGLTNRVLGAQGGTETVTLTTQQLPAHTHQAYASAGAAASAQPSGNVPATPGNGGLFYLPPVSGQTQQDFPADTIQTAGGSQPHDNIMPILAITYIIALQGIFPSQN
jgi:microcystin-dependent protein